MHLTDVENQLSKPDPVVKCHHAVHQEECSKTLSRGVTCPTEDSVKYKMVRVSVESVNVFLAETECVCNVQVIHWYINILFYIFHTNNDIF